MLKDLLREVVASIVGKQAEGIVELLYEKGYVNEFLVAKKLDVTINQARNFLYKLSDYGLVSSIRKKDKKKGWYTYFWQIETLKSLEFLKNILSKNIDNLNAQLNSRETKQFYVCKRCNVEQNEENALLCNFTCAECGDIFESRDNSKLVKDLKRSIEKAKEQLKIVLDELGSETAKFDKKRFAGMKREENKKAKEKKTKREEQAKVRAKEKKKMEKFSKKTKKPAKIKKQMKKSSKKNVHRMRSHRMKKKKK